MTTATIALLLAAAQPKRAAQPTRDVVLQQIHGVVDGAQLLRPCSSNVSPNPSMAAVDLVLVVPVPADAILPAVPSPHWWVQKERNWQPKVMMLALEGEAEEFKTKNFNCCFLITAKSIRVECSRPRS